jgi:CHAD domain-containing protein
MNRRLHQRALSSARDLELVRTKLEARLKFRKLPPRAERRSFLDTFDWRLYRAGQVLEFDGDERGTLRLRELGAAGRVIEQEAVAIPAFGRELPAGPLRRALVQIAEPRALLNLGSVLVRTAPWRVEDARGKLLAVMENERIRADARGGRRPGTSHWLRVLPLRGYDRQALKILLAFDEAGARAEDPLRRCMQQFGRQPGDYDSRLRIPLESDIDARRALSRILLFLLEVMEVNRHGIEADIDVEFLHDFRIACRRSRSLITQVRGVFTEDELKPFRSAFSWLSAATSAQRDLDVFLLDMPRYRAMLPFNIAPHLEPLAELIVAERRAAHARLLRALRSARMTAFLRDWRRFLERGSTKATPSTGRAAAAAGHAIRRVHRRLLKEGNRCGAGTYSEVLHELRKNGKKLRYLLEAFRSLYPEEDIEGFIGQLRKLQNILGDIVDYHVQHDYLLARRAELAQRGGLPEETMEAMNRLAIACENLQERAEHRFLDRFRRFSGPANSARLERMLAEGG